MKQLIIIPCCKRKVEGGTEINQGLTFFENVEFVPDLIERRNERININPLTNQQLLPAWDRYDGLLYRRLKEYKPVLEELIAENKIDILIISALYGVININTPIANYNLKMHDKGVLNFWRSNNVLGHSINEYCLQNDIQNIYTFLSPETYYRTLTGLREHIRIWPNGLRGCNKIINQQAELIIHRMIKEL